jgi:hypothetical protein
MDWIVASGAFSFGAVVGILTGYFVSEAEKMDQKILKSAVGVVGGTAVLGLFSLLTGPNGIPHEIWLYPVGLLVGFIGATVYEHVYPVE